MSDLSNDALEKSTISEEPPNVSHQADNSHDEEYPTTLKLLGVIVALVLAVFLASLDMNIITTAIPRITDDFHSLDDVGWYGSALFLTVAST